MAVLHHATSLSNTEAKPCKHAGWACGAPFHYRAVVQIKPHKKKKNQKKNQKKQKNGYFG